MIRIPRDFSQRVVGAFGGEGASWLDRLDELVCEYGRRWTLGLGDPVEDLSYNYVAPARRSDGSEAILKLGVPNHEFSSELAALRAYDGRGAVRLLEEDEGDGAMLLERARPGLELVDLEDDEEATAIAADVMKRLCRPAPDDERLLTVERWGRGFERMRRRFEGGCGPMPAKIVDAGERLFAELLASSEAPALLHGDLHHWNILSSEREPWLAIDPKGVIGEPAYEVGCLLRNPWNRLLDRGNPRRVQERRIAILSERLGFDRERIRAWGLAQAVLSAWWTVEDGGRNWQFPIACAEVLDQL